eukprot:scaffold1440_cov114-Isochrysis_galbana.AAC.13
MPPVVPLSGTVLQPSSLHARAPTSQNLHWSEPSHMPAPLRIRSNTSRCDGWPTQLRTVSLAANTGNAISSGSSKEVSWVWFAKTEKETVGPARLSEAFKTPPCTSAEVVHMATVTGTPASACRVMLPGSRMVALLAPPVSYVSCPEVAACTVMLSSGDVTRTTPALRTDMSWSNPNTTPMVLRICRPASMALASSGSG